MPLPCLAPGMTTNSRSLPAVRSLCANLAHTIFIMLLWLLLGTLYIKHLVGSESLTRCTVAQVKNVVLSNGSLNILFLWNLPGGRCDVHDVLECDVHDVHDVLSTLKQV